MQKRLMFVAFLLMAICSKIVADDQLTISSFSLYHGVSKEVSVELTNSDAYVGFQFDLYLPDGVTVESYGGSADRLPSGTTPQMAQQSDGGYRFIAAALGGNTITGSSGAVMTITLRAGEGVATGDYTAYMRNVKISKADGSGEVAAEQAFTITVKGAEPYYVLSDGNTVLTFYYDTQVEVRGGLPISNTVTDGTAAAVVNWSTHVGTIASVVFDASFGGWQSQQTTRSWFQNCVNLSSITGLQYLHTDNVADMSYMFYGCAQLTSLDLSGFNTASVANMQGMFAGCTGLTSLDLSSFNTANVSDMSYLFYGDTALQDITFGSDFQTTNVGNMYGMFAMCTGLTSLDLTKVTTGMATNLAYMFAYCSGLTSIDVSHFDTSFATDISGMFGYCSGLTAIDVSSFNTGNVTAMSGLFTNCTSLTTLDVSSFSTANVTTMGGDAADDGMFSQCPQLTTIYVGSGWNTANVTTSANMFTGSTSLVGGAGTTYDANHVDKEYARIDGGTAQPGYLTPGSGYGQVAVPTFSWSGDSLVISCATPEAEIWFTITDAGSTLLPDTMLYTQPLLVTSDVHVTAQGKKVNWTNSDIVELDYPGATWQTLTAAIAAANNAIEQGQGNERVNPTQITELQTIVASAGQMYGERTATVDAINGMVNDLTTATAAIMELVNAVDEPYALLDGQTLTFYYDKNKIPLSGMAVGPFTSDAQRPWNAAAATITTVVFDDSFAAHRPTATAFWFSGFTALTTLSGLDNLNTSEVTYMDGMFTNCSSLKTIYINNDWDLSNVTSSISMFNNCTSLVGGQWTTYASSRTTAQYARIDGGTSAPGYFTSWADTITPATVTFSRDMYQLTMTCETANTHIMYAVVPDGSAAAPTWQQYGGPVTLTEDCTVRAYAERPSGLRSAETEYTFKMSDVSTVERPVMAWSGDDMSLTTSTEGATIYYTAEVGGTAPTIETYTAPVAITQDCVLSAWAAKAGLNNSDTLVVDYPYTAWQQLLSALGAAQAVAQQAQTSPRISDSMRGALVQLINEGQAMYNERTATEDEILERANQIYTVAGNIQQLMDEVYEPYAVLSADGLTVTFYYDGQKQARGGVDINSGSSTPPYSSATTAVIDASFADYYPTSTACWFYGCSNLTGIDGMANLKTDNVTNMSSMFFGCSGLTSLDVSGFNTANVTYMGYMFEGCSGLTSLDVSSFNIANVTNMSEMFRDCSGLTSLDVSGFNTANVTNMGGVFSGCSGLTSLDVSGFNTANVTDMGFMFSGCSGLTSLDVSGFNIANVTYMGYMFNGCSGLTSLDLSGFNTANVTGMTGMFWSCNSLKTIYVGEEWSTAKVTDSSDMFSGCTALVGGMGTVYDVNHVDAAYAHIDGGTANPGYLTSANAPSSYAVTLKAVGNGTVKTADITVANGGEQDIAVAPGASLTLAFTPDAGNRLENVTVDDTDVTSQVTADSTGVSYYTLMSIYAAHTVTATFVNDTKEAYAVLSADSLTVTFYYDTQKQERGGVDINVYNVSSSAYSSATTAVIDASFADYYPTSTSYWFKACSNLTSIDGMANLKTGNVTDMVSMFDGCSGLTSLDLSGFNTANVTSMYGVFSSCSGLTSLDVSGFNTANVTIMFGMFSGCSGLTSLDLSGFNTDNVTSMRAMFLGCSDLTSLDVSGFNTANVTDMGVMFDGCSGLTSLDLSSFNTANVTSMNSMFSGCSNLTTIYVGEEWSTEKVTDGSYMFSDCTALVGGAWTAYDANYTDAAYAHIDGGTANPGYLTSVADATVPAVVTYSRVGHTVTLSSATENVHIMYTLSTWPFADDEPQWQQYTEPLALTEDCTITAYAVRPSGLRSADTEYNFVLNANFVEAPTIARDGEEYRVVITNNSTTGTVYYNYDANGQLTATNSSQYVGPIDVSQNVRINAAVIIDGVVSSDITSFTVDWFKVATPTYTWDADKLTATTTTDGATVEVSLTLPGDSVAAQVSGGVQTAIVTVEQDVRIDIRAMKDGWTDADVVSFDYPYTAWMQLMQAVDHGLQTMAAAAQSDKVDTVSPDAPYATLNTLIDDADLLYHERTAKRAEIEYVTEQIMYYISLLEQEMNAVDEFAYDADNGVLHVYGDGTLDEALTAAGGREEVAQTLTAILWDKTETPLTDDMLQGLTGNPNLLIYVPTIEQAPVTVHNVVVGDRAEDILLVDATEGNSDFYCPRTFMADRISYTRSFTQQTQVGVTRGWESIVLPFTVQTVSHESHGQLAPFGSSDSDQHFWLRQLSADGLERATQIEAYRPYLISMPNDSANYSAASCHAGRVTFSAANVLVEVGAPHETMLADDSRILIGTMKRMAASADIYVLNVGQPEGTYLEGSIFVSHLREVRPFECYTLHASGGSRYIGFGELDGSATLGIDGLTFDGMSQEQWFTLDGMKLQQRPAAKGVYILNGRKVVIK